MSAHGESPSLLCSLFWFWSLLFSVFWSPFWSLWSSYPLQALVFSVFVVSRSRVWAEPCLLACAVKKLGGSVERWLGVAEELFGPYLWGR